KPPKPKHEHRPTVHPTNAATSPFDSDSAPCKSNAMASTDVASKQERVRIHVTGRHIGFSPVLQNSTSCKNLAGRGDDGHAAAINNLSCLAYHLTTIRCRAQPRLQSIHSG
nr:hypothetical protein [Gammaproteobacteria bacterium]